MLRYTKLWLSSAIQPIFICDFDWKERSTHLDQPVEFQESWFHRTQTVSEFVIDITFRTTDGSLEIKNHRPWQRVPGPYRGEAPRPRTFSVRLEKGIFKTPVENGGVKACFHELRLVFDISPYGTRPDWGMHDTPWWEIKEFVARQCEAPGMWPMKNYVNNSCTMS